MHHTYDKNEAFYLPDPMSVLIQVDVWGSIGGSRGDLTLTLGRESLESLARNNDLRLHQSAPLVTLQLSCTALSSGVKGCSFTIMSGTKRYLSSLVS